MAKAKTVDQLLDAIKERHGIASDYKLAQFLGMTDGAIRHYRHGRSLPDELACQRIGDALGMDGDVLAAQMLARRAKTDEGREFWQRIAGRLGGPAAAKIAVLAAIVFVAQFLGGTDSYAAPSAVAHASALCTSYQLRRERQPATLKSAAPQPIPRP